MIIEVNGGRYEKLNIVRRDVKTKGVQHLVLWDRDCQNTEKYGISAWPIAYLIGPDGKVVWDGNPARVINRAKPLQQLLGEIQKQLNRQKLIAKTSLEQNRRKPISGEKRP